MPTPTQFPIRFKTNKRFVLSFGIAAILFAFMGFGMKTSGMKEDWDGGDDFMLGGLFIAGSLLLYRGINPVTKLVFDHNGISGKELGRVEPWSNVKEVQTGIRRGYKGIEEPFFVIHWKEDIDSFSMNFSDTNWKMDQFEKEVFPLIENAMA